MADNSLTNSTTQPNTADSREEDLDASIEADISQEPLNQDSMDVDAKDETMNASSSTVLNAENPAMTDPRIPAKKDASLREFLNNMDDYAPIVRSDLCACAREYADVKETRYQMR